MQKIIIIESTDDLAIQQWLQYLKEIETRIKIVVIEENY